MCVCVVQLMGNPEMLRQLMDNPMIQQLMSNPDVMRQLITGNPQMRELMEVGRSLCTPHVALCRKHRSCSTV